MMKKPQYRSRREKVEANLKEGEYVFDSSEMSVEVIQERAALGMHPVCACCGARLEYALSPAETKKHGTYPGVRCPVNLGHCQIVVDFARDAG
ncbi:hypothetical protein [Prosthecobacter fluviatilis]|uniref:Uncharacterized protein n=1 Tax=Prosthecobacter fluviatilis TaxID=445931 RepID=A0ABW0KUY0_9BACT